MAVLGSGSIASRKPVENAAIAPTSSTEGHSNYDSLKVKLERSITSGLTFMNSFTWAKSLGTTSAYDFIGPPGYVYDLNLSYGRNDFNIPVINTTSFVYNLPVGRGKRFGSNMGGIPDQIIGGWEASGIINIRSGTGYSVLSGEDIANLGINPGETAQIVSAPVPSGFKQTRAAWFNTSAFTFPASGTLGNSAPDFLNGPAYQNLDFALMKNFRIGENLKLQFRSEFFNILNHTTFGNPDSTMTDATFGQILGANSPRIIQFALKLLW